MVWQNIFKLDIEGNLQKYGLSGILFRRYIWEEWQKDQTHPNKVSTNA